MTKENAWDVVAYGWGDAGPVYDMRDGCAKTAVECGARGWGNITYFRLRNGQIIRVRAK